MQGPSRTSFRQVSEGLFVRADAETTDAGALGRDLMAVAALLGQHVVLRRLLADAGTPAEARVATARDLLGGRVGDDVVDVVADVVQARWSSAPDLVDAVERLGAMALFAEAEDAERLDAVEDELYRLARIVAADDRLRTALSASWLPVERKIALVRDLIEARVDPTTLTLLEHVLVSRRGRSVDNALELLAGLAGARRGRIYAQAFTATPLDGAQLARLEAAVSRVYGRIAKVSVVVDPSMLGGVRLVVGDEVIDGSVAHRLDQARDSLAG